MPVLNHVLIVLSYSVLAVALGVALPFHVPAVDPRLAGELAGLAVIVSGAAHFVLSRLWHDREVDAQITALQAEVAQTRAELVGARDEAARIHAAIETALIGRRDKMADIEAIMAEVRVLQGLVTQLSAAPAQAEAVEVRQAVAGAALARAPRPLVRTPSVLTGLDEGQVLGLVRDGLRNNRIDLFVQPIVSLPQRRHRHYECFSRIRAEDGATVITPEQYLAIAEREGLIGTIDNMLLFRSVQLVRRLQKRDNMSLFVNISEHTLADRTFFRDFVAFVTGERELASKIVFEFAQTHVARHGEAVRLELERLARLGFRFSMDQVTSLDLDVDELAARHFRFIKIDAGRLLEHTRAQERTFDLAGFKRALERSGIDLIVERIESEAQVIELLDFPVDFGQGYLFGEPRLARED